MKIYLCIKVGIQEDGTYVFVQTEAAFTDKTKAESYFTNQVKSWKETIENVPCDCVRALHEIEVTQ